MYDPERWIKCLDEERKLCTPPFPSLRELVEAAGFDRRMVNGWKGGARPSGETCEKIAEILGITKDNLLFAADYATKLSLEDRVEALLRRSNFSKAKRRRYRKLAKSLGDGIFQTLSDFINAEKVVNEVSAESLMPRS